MFGVGECCVVGSDACGGKSARWLVGIEDFLKGLALRGLAGGTPALPG